MIDAVEVACTLAKPDLDKRINVGCEGPDRKRKTY